MFLVIILIAYPGFHEIKLASGGLSPRPKQPEYRSPPVLHVGSTSRSHSQMDRGSGVPSNINFLVTSGGTVLHKNNNVIIAILNPELVSWYIWTTTQPSL